mmetsp:Transcript_8208/g.8206  ORF Transcript_8208/g.8206 Transcript_8208/m.8206 type:complete len:95 (+) Transcript_8208:108-392(+)
MNSVEISDPVLSFGCETINQMMENMRAKMLLKWNFLAKSEPGRERVQRDGPDKRVSIKRAGQRYEDIVSQTKDMNGNKCNRGTVIDIDQKKGWL